MLPSASSFGEDPPGLTMVVDLSTKMRNTLTVTVEVLTFVHIFSTKNSPDSQLLQIFGCLFLGIMFLAPTNGVGGVGKPVQLSLNCKLTGLGYTFWTTNENCHKLSHLHTMIFNGKYRETLAKDGTSNFICDGNIAAL